MKIWHMKFQVNDYANFDSVEDLHIDYMLSFDGRSHLVEWKPMPVTIMEPEKDLPLCDAPGFFIPAFSQRALDRLLPLIREYVEVLPLVFPGEAYYGINVTTVLDAIDYEKSDYKTFKSSGRIMCFEKYAFIPEAVAGKPIFKIKDEDRSKYPFVSEEFKEIVERSGLTGFDLKLVWDSETD